MSAAEAAKLMERFSGPRVGAGATDEGDAITSAAMSLLSLAPALVRREEMAQEIADAERAAARGYFLPDEDDRVRGRFAQYLTVRAGLLQTIRELEPAATKRANPEAACQRLKAFTIAYTAACLLVHAARILVRELAAHKLVQRKLNEPEPRLGIPAGQYTAVFRSLTSPFTAWRLRDAICFFEAHRSDITALREHDALMGRVLQVLDEFEGAVRVPVKHYAFARLRYRWHAVRRGRAVAAQQALFAVLEIAGRVLSDIRRPWHVKRITPEVRQQVASLLQPGDVLVTRHEDAMTNLFLPGYWPHSALHIGHQSWCRSHLSLKDGVARKWVDPLCVLEAKKDGVLLRRLDETLAVDAVAVIRPRLEPHEVAAGIARALEHEGKLYNFDFDFFRSDRLVCSEVIYRAYHGLGPVQFELTPRVGRPTLSCEDILAMALAGEAFDVVCVYGAGNAQDRIVFDAEAAEVLRASCRNARNRVDAPRGLRGT